ncbi:hypothetical protein GCM10007301_31960 [Azorhizobium oxalatiphilum]|uniref:Uncharacterized protein n=1 Tax=Azorhizobium oxalatiphilum TaxID=980631 RepID=A0A917C471_9HYPH|nr:hypothetical protein GCM10007301_31960 [Azorhizobium oxalatiphilum]
MTRDARNLDQNPLVVDPANLDAVLKDRPSPARPPLKEPLKEHHAEYKDQPREKEDGHPDARVPPREKRA